MFDAPRRPLVFPLKEQLANEVEAPVPEPFCPVPVFPEDSDEKITVLFRLSLNDFVALASAIDVGSDIAFGLDAVKIWQLWVTAYMCAQFCEEMAICLTDENPAVVAALANLLQNNPTLLEAINAANAQNGGATPGQPISDEQSNQDTLPDNVKDAEGECLPNELWGAALYLVQSGNRAIVDVFEIIESASNTLENMEIISKNIPAAGNFISSAAAFADQLQEVIAEGYAAAYTETFEENLSCDIFCRARANCELTVDMLMDMMNDRLSEPIDLGDFGEIMAGVATGTWVGDDIANVAFLLFFAALRFGQQFGGTVGIRPLNILMSLGADQLASDNWEVLCDCPPVCPAPEWRVVNPLGTNGGSFDQTDNMDGTWTVVFTAAQTDGVDAWRLAVVEANGCCWNAISVVYSITPENLNNYYTCGANPDDTDYGSGSVAGSVPEDECSAGVLAASLSSPFTVTVIYEACP